MLRRDGARVSKATVYNTLNLFAARGLIRQLTLDGSCAWFDSNVRRTTISRTSRPVR